MKRGFLGSEELFEAVEDNMQALSARANFGKEDGMEQKEKEIRKWSKVHNIPSLRYMIEVLDRERESHGQEAHSYLTCIAREKKLMRLLDSSRCPHCKKEPRSK